MRELCLTPAARALYDAALKHADEHGWVLCSVYYKLPEFGNEADYEIFRYAVRGREWRPEQRIRLVLEGLTSKAEALYWEALARVDDNGRMWPHEFRALPCWSQDAEDELRHNLCVSTQHKLAGRDADPPWAECIAMAHPSFAHLAAHLRQQRGEL